MTPAMPAAHPYGSPSPPAPSRLREEGLAAADRNFAIWIHLSPLIAFMIAGPFAVLAPLILWLIRKDMSPFVDDHGREVVNFAITGVIVTFLAVVPVIGWILAPIWFLVGLVSVIRGAMAANNGEYFRYPLTFRFVT